MMDAAKNVRYKNNGHVVMFHQYAIENVVMESTMLVKNVMMVMITNLMDVFKNCTIDAQYWRCKNVEGFPSVCEGICGDGVLVGKEKQ